MSVLLSSSFHGEAGSGDIGLAVSSPGSPAALPAAVGGRGSPPPSLPRRLSFLAHMVQRWPWPQRRCCLAMSEAEIL